MVDRSLNNDWERCGKKKLWSNFRYYYYCIWWEELRKDVGRRNYGPISGITTTASDGRKWGKMWEEEIMVQFQVLLLLHLMGGTEERSKPSVKIINIWTKIEPRVFSPPWHNSPYRTRIPSLSKLHNHTQTHHIWWDSSGRAFSPTKKHRPAHHTTFTRDKHPCLQWDSYPQPQQAISHRPMLLTAWWLGSEKPEHTEYKLGVLPFWS